MSATTAPTAPAAPTADSFARPASRARRETSIRLALAAATAVGVVVLAVLLVRVGTEGARFLSVDFLTNFPSSISPEQSGVSNGLTGTLSLMLIVTVGSSFIFPLELN